MIVKDNITNFYFRDSNNNFKKIECIPYIPYKIEFASAVNRKLYPYKKIENHKAIVVELDSDLLNALRIHLKNLNNVYKDGLPLLTGLLKKRDNYGIYNLINSINKANGIKNNLQKRHEEFDLLPVSPNDATIEAVRCSMELNIPIHGVPLINYCSLKQYPPGDYPDVSLMSPKMYKEYYNIYHEINPWQYNSVIPAEILARAYLLAWSINNIKDKYKTIIVICNINYWHLVKKILLSNEFTFNPLEHETIQKINHEVSRTIPEITIDPSIAVNFTDELPILAYRYELYRCLSQKAHGSKGTYNDFGLDKLEGLKLFYKKIFRKLTASFEEKNNITPEYFHLKKNFENCIKSFTLHIADYTEIYETYATFTKENDIEILEKVMIDINWIERDKYTVLVSVKKDDTAYFKTINKNKLEGCTFTISNYIKKILNVQTPFKNQTKKIFISKANRIRIYYTKYIYDLIKNLEPGIKN